MFNQTKVVDVLRRCVVAIPLLASLCVSGCAFDLMDVRYTTSLLKAQSGSGRSFLLADEVRLTQTPCRYQRTLHAGTRWTLVGSLPQGEVFTSSDQVLTLECSNVFEAYLVVSGKRLVGFYLPVERGFVALRNPIELGFKG
jgi:hypothetical protein